MTPRDPEKFWQLVQEKFFIDEIVSLDYDEFLDLGESCGLLRQVPYDETVHGEMVGDPEPGDMIYEPVAPSGAQG